jgi:hypothetical protein
MTTLERTGPRPSSKPDVIREKAIARTARRIQEHGLPLPPYQRLWEISQPMIGSMIRRTTAHITIPVVKSWAISKMMDEGCRFDYVRSSIRMNLEARR